MDSSASDTQSKNAPAVRRRIRLVNADPRFSEMNGNLMPEAACGCDSNNPCNTDVPVCVGDVPIQGNKVCGIYG